MPNDSTHRIINYLLLSVFVVANFYFGITSNFTDIAVFMVVYVIGTEYLNPDLDTNSSPARRLGILSYPIRKLSKHRGHGHSIFIGWALKVLYVVVIITIIAFVIDWLNLSSYIPSVKISNEVIYVSLFSLFLSNLVHIVADRISTFWKLHT